MKIKFSINDIDFAGEYNEEEDTLNAFADDVLTDEEFESLENYTRDEDNVIVARDGRGALLTIEEGAGDWLEFNEFLDLEGGDES